MLQLIEVLHALRGKKPIDFDIKIINKKLNWEQLKLFTNKIS